MASRTTTETGVHPFQQSGLGVAPFSYIGHTEIAQRLPDGSTRAAGSCDHCGACIRWAFSIKSSDGKVSKVGCDCICKLNRDDNRFIGQVEAQMRSIKKAAAQAANAKRADKNAERIAAAFDLWDANREQFAAKLSAMPHPKNFAGLTCLDFCLWMKANAGQSGKLEVAKLLEQVAAACCDMLPASGAQAVRATDKAAADAKAAETVRVPLYGQTYSIRRELAALGGSFDYENKVWMIPANSLAEAKELLTAAPYGE